MREKSGFEKILTTKEAHERHESMPELQALIVLGKNQGMARNIIKGKPEPDLKGNVLSQETKMAALAAGWLYSIAPEKVNKIILSGGKTSGPKANSEAGSMANYIRERFPAIPETAIIIEENSYDTISAAKQLKNILEAIPAAQEEAKIGLLVFASHKDRAVKNMNESGIKTTPLIVEEILAEISFRHKDFIDKYKRSGFTKADELKEIAVRLLYSTPAGRQILELIAKGRIDE